MSTYAVWTIYIEMFVVFPLSQHVTNLMNYPSSDVCVNYNIKFQVSQLHIDQEVCPLQQNGNLFIL